MKPSTPRVANFVGVVIVVSLGTGRVSREICTMKAKMAVFLVLAIVILASCSGPMTPLKVSDGGIVETDNLFVALATTPGAYSMKIDDIAYLGPSGYTLWSLKGTSQTPFVSETVTVTKRSGDEWAGYGMVFCQYDTGDPLLGETMLVAMIDTHGEYIVGEATRGSFTAFCDWTASTSLVQGLGAANIISVVKSGSQFVLSLNGTEAYRFQDSGTPSHDGGRSGLIAVISPDDQLPWIPVQVDYQIQ